MQLLRTIKQRKELLKCQNEFELEALLHHWLVWARDNQLPPDGNWRTWLLMGGRGAGKTRAGAEWLRYIALGQGNKKDSVFVGDAGGHIALIGETFQDAQSIMIEGESGLLAVHRRDERPQWISSRRLLKWPNGVEGHVYSASDPDALRGSQFGACWSDEIAKWPYLSETWDMLQFCMRLGSFPRQLVTTTPRPLTTLKKIMNDKSTALTRSSTLDNRDNLAPGFIDFITGEYGGTRLGRQEIDGEIIEDREDGLWTRSQIEALCVREAPALERVVVALDPPVSSNQNSDACGIIAVGKDESGVCYVLADETLQPATPQMWARKAADLYHRFSADCIVAEVNQGGEMVETILGMVDSTIAVRPVRAKRGKWLRAEPVALLYAKGMVRHVGAFGALEDQLCDFGPDGLSNGRSPDRIDALVWAIHELALRPQSRPRVRSA